MRVVGLDSIHFVFISNIYVYILYCIYLNGLEIGVYFLRNDDDLTLWHAL